MTPLPDPSQSPQEYFRLILLTVVGQAFSAADYHLEERPHQWAGGLFRFTHHLSERGYASIEFQLLAYTDTLWSSGNPSRFRVSLIHQAPSAPPVVCTLSRLVVEHFQVAILPSADHWWTFRTTAELGRALAEAGHLAVGFAIPWLNGDLQLPSVGRRASGIDTTGTDPHNPPYDDPGI